MKQIITIVSGLASGRAELRKQPNYKKYTYRIEKHKNGINFIKQYNIH